MKRGPWGSRLSLVYGFEKSIILKKLPHMVYEIALLVLPGGGEKTAIFSDTIF